MAQSESTDQSSTALEKAMPLVFVLIWATGFITAKYALPYAEPITTLSWRMTFVLLLLVPFILIFARSAVNLSQFAHSMVSGGLIHGVYLGGVFFAISRGMPAGVSALVVAIQPLLTVFIARFLLGERIEAKQMFWFLAALFGVFLIVWPKLEISTEVSGINPLTLAAVSLSAFGISLGAVYQKRFVTNMDLRHSTAAQYVGAVLVLLPMSFLFESREVDWNVHYSFAIAWMVIPLSLGSVALLMILIRRGSSASVASLFYLVPAVSSLMAYFLFNETLTPVQLLGGLVIVISVAMATTGNKKAR